MSFFSEALIFGRRGIIGFLEFSIITTLLIASGTYNITAFSSISHGDAYKDRPIQFKARQFLNLINLCGSPIIFTLI